MCGHCGRPGRHDEPWTMQMHRSLQLIRELYATRDGINGGPLHVWVEDLNLYDDQAYNKDPIDYSLPIGYVWNDESSLRRICDELFPLLMGLTENERFTTVVAFHNERYGYKEPYDDDDNDDDAETNVKAWINAVQFTCDGCGKLENATTDELPISWFGGDVTSSQLTGDFGGEWHACSRKCILQAIKNTLGD